ncbi:DNA endonuclease IV [Salmonella phage vB_SenM-AKM_NP4]|uniref:DNA endonuclease IV n=1 Tax=Salmonella phage S16 TaxID=1087482 RepID=M1EAI2_BPS16|nr:DenB-like DNA endonuclease IV [Salmonella phage vB_SenM-S16]AEO97180.1 DNA endonuclease IV [Salmonella phage vB_SenM-S16]WLI71884.1 DNA endonuclease IV [Salmonella phage vB_SenM-AKM_NP4]
MNKNNPGLLRLKKLPTFIRGKNDLTPEDRVKIKDTVNYTMSKDPGQDKEAAVKRCMIAQLAEKAVAEWVNGYVMHGQENHDDPYTFAWDVLAHPRYCGLRIEVKTHQSESKWISVTTGYSGNFPYGYGVNLGPFLNHQVADCIIILDVVENLTGGFEFTPVFVGDPEDTKKIVKRSKYEGWYLMI